MNDPILALLADLYTQVRHLADENTALKQEIERLTNVASE